MLMTKLKTKEELLNMIDGKVFAVTCYGCKELNISTAEAEADALIRSLAEQVDFTGGMTTDYICNPEYLKARFEKYADQIEAADMILVFSCGVGVQTLAAAYPHKRVCAACDTYRLPGFQGVTPLEHDCRQCGQCYLNLTGGICPITACSKSLVNGQCGGAKDGKCEVDPSMECGWERIYQKLKQLGRLDAMRCPVQLRDYSVENN